MNYKQKALEHVRSVCPELMELSFGCILIDENDGKQYTYVNGGDHHTEDAWMMLLDSKSLICSDENLGFDAELEIIGHTPHLEHWLRGIKATAHKDWLGEVWNSILWPQRYDLTKDGENQSEDFYKTYCTIVGITPEDK